jgi:hypothetical protein
MICKMKRKRKYHKKRGLLFIRIGADAKLDLLLAQKNIKFIYCFRFFSYQFRYLCDKI